MVSKSYRHLFQLMASIVPATIDLSVVMDWCAGRAQQKFPACTPHDAMVKYIEWYKNMRANFSSAEFTDDERASVAMYLVNDEKISSETRKEIISWNKKYVMNNDSEKLSYINEFIKDYVGNARLVNITLPAIPSVWKFPVRLDSTATEFTVCRADDTREWIYQTPLMIVNATSIVCCSLAQAGIITWHHTDGFGGTDGFGPASKWIIEYLRGVRAICG